MCVTWYSKKVNLVSALETKAPYNVVYLSFTVNFRVGSQGVQMVVKIIRVLNLVSVLTGQHFGVWDE